MLTSATFLTILGIIIFCLYSIYKNKFFRFHKIIPFFINLLWIFLLSKGIYNFWKTNPKVIPYIISCLLLLLIFNYFLTSEKQKAKKYFRIYKKLKIKYPEISEEEILQKTVKLYYKKIRLNNYRIKRITQVMFNQTNHIEEGVKELAYLVFGMETYTASKTPNFKKNEKRKKTIDWAYEKILKNENLKTIEKIQEKQIIDLILSSKRKMPGHFTSSESRTQTLLIDFKELNADDDYEIASAAWHNLPKISSPDDKKNEIFLCLKIGEDIMAASYIIYKLYNTKITDNIKNQLILQNIEKSPKSIQESTQELINQKEMNEYFNFCSHFGFEKASAQ